MSAISLLLVDDHELVRLGIKRLLADVKSINVVAEAKSGEEAIQQYRKSKAKVIMMDVKMPGMGGLEATRRIVRADRDAKVIVVTVYSGEPFPSRLLQAGALGYITKGASLSEMVHAIEVVSTGQRYLSPEVAQQLALKHVSPEKQVTPFDGLSEREMQVMIMLTNGQKVQEISEILCLSPKTVSSYRYRIFDKLKVRTDVELTHLAIRHGVLEREDAISG